MAASASTGAEAVANLLAGAAAAAVPMAPMDTDGGHRRRRGAGGTVDGGEVSDDDEKSRSKTRSRGKPPGDRDAAGGDDDKRQLSQKDASEIQAKLLLNLAQRVRDLESAIFRTAIIGEGTKVAQSIKARMTKYAEITRKDGKQHEQGPPNISAWAGLMDGLITEGGDTQPMNFLREKYKQWQELETKEEKAAYVLHCRLAKTSKQDKKRLQWACRDKSVEDFVAVLVRGQGGEIKGGRGPAINMERIISQQIGNKSNKKK